MTNSAARPRRDFMVRSVDTEAADWLRASATAAGVPMGFVLSALIYKARDEGWRVIPAIEQTPEGDNGFTASCHDIPQGEWPITGEEGDLDGMPAV